MHLLWFDVFSIYCNETTGVQIVLLLWGSTKEPNNNQVTDTQTSRAWLEATEHSTEAGAVCHCQFGSLEQEECIVKTANQV